MGQSNIITRALSGLLLISFAAGMSGIGDAFADDELSTTKLYEAHCAGCHGSAQSGGAFGPALRGEGFSSRWANVQELQEFIGKAMPPSNPGVLLPKEAAALAAFLSTKALEKPKDIEGNTVTGGNKVGSFVDQLRQGNVGPVPARPEVFHDKIYDEAVSARRDLLARLTPVTDDMLASPSVADWLTWRRSTDFQGFSPLTQVNAKTVANLQPVWSWSLSVSANEAAPLVHDGVMFVSSGGVVQALEAATGTLLWSYTRQMDSAYKGLAQKSIALYGDKIYVSTGDRHVVALEARTGKLIWDREILSVNGIGPFLSAGVTAAKGRVIQGITLGPACKGGCAIVGLDSETGAIAWHFNTVAHSDTPGGETWNGAPDDVRYGGGVWAPPSYDPKTGLIYVGVGQTYEVAPLLVPRGSTGGNNDALYTDSTLAIDPVTGRLAWYHQHLHRDIWDLDEAFERILVTLSDKAGALRDVMLTMGKIGILDALDPKTGSYLFSWDAGLQNIVTSIDPVTGRRSYNPAFDPQPDKVFDVCPSPEGVRNWMAASYDARRAILYLPLEATCMDYSWRPDPDRDAAQRGIDISWSVKPHPSSAGNYGRLVALDVVNRRPLWINRSRAPLSSSLLATAGGILFSGSRDRMFYAFDSKTGKRLWQIRLNAVPNSTPISYSVDGQQYIAVTTGGGGPHDRESKEITPEIDDAGPTTTLWVFALNANK